MISKVNWESIFLQCRENVLAHVRPMLKKTKRPQPDLGRGAGGDQMRMVDLVAEKAIVEVLQLNSISFTLISEESGIQKYGNDPESCFVTVDPIDGTTNLLRGLPFYCTSIAISDEPKLSKVFAGMVADLFHGTTYTAILGNGAYRNGEKISTSAVESLKEAVVGIDLNTSEIVEIFSNVSDLIQKAKHIRHFGANALELCFVAEGLTDSFVDIRGKLRTTDFAAAFLILREAGGTITNLQGQFVDAKLDPKQTLKFVASGNLPIHKQILKLIRSK